MFDFTREVILDTKEQRTYRALQAILYLAAFIAALYLSYLIIFPHKNFFFSFSDPSAKDNNIDLPRFDSGEYLNGQGLLANQNLLLDTDITSDYSFAKATLNTVSSDGESKQDFSISVRRSYEAFMYPKSEPIGFRTGTLLKNDGTYYIVSNSKLRKFSSHAIVSVLGYPEDAFQEVPADDLKYNQAGLDIFENDSYPDDTLFRIDNNYYILKNRTLQKFVSDQAYTTKYEKNQAIPKDIDFLNDYPIADDLAGFSDGSLISNADSVFIVSSGQIWPIDNPDTFVKKGYSWDDVMQAGEDELAPYQKAKLFNITTAHPNGTVFKTEDTDKFYMIENGEKHPLPSNAIALSWLKKSPIIVSDQALETYASCFPQANFWNSSSYSCNIPLGEFSNFSGFSYEFSLASSSPVQLDSFSIDYKKNIDKNNFKSFVLNLYNLTKSRYIPS